MLEPTSDARLREMFASRIDFRKYSERKDDWLTTDCPAIIVSTYQARKGSWNLPVLVGTIAAPLMKDDGTILSKPGYDKETGLLSANPSASAVPGTRLEGC
jgi:putative DNA primase/helicase